MKESAGKPTDDTQEIMQDDENNTENTQQKISRVRYCWAVLVC